MSYGGHLLPRMNELMAFAAAARHSSFTHAAVELNLTQGAVSRAIAELEGRMGVKLFERIRQRVVLTDTGRQYFGEVRTLLDQLGTATHQAMATPQGGETLNLAVLPTFATHWLMHHLPDFTAKFPHVTLNLSTRIRPFSFAEESFDAAIHHGRPIWPGAITRHLMDESMLPMCSPEYRSKLALRKPTDLRGATLIHPATRPGAWAEWLQGAGVEPANAFRGPTYDQFGMVAAAAAAGIGAALLPKFLVEQQIRERKLVLLFDIPLHTRSAYYIVLPELPRQLASDFASWAATRLLTTSSAKSARPKA